MDRFGTLAVGGAEGKHIAVSIIDIATRQKHFSFFIYHFSFFIDRFGTLTVRVARRRHIRSIVDLGGRIIRHRDQAKAFFIFHLSFFIDRSGTLTVRVAKRRPSMIRDQAKANDLQDRLVDLAVSIINLATRLPKTFSGRHVATQMLRSGTSPAANYGEARGAESRADFVHKLRLAVKELNETAIWLEIIRRSGLIEAGPLADLIEENRQLSCILSSAIKTASKGKQQPCEK